MGGGADDKTYNLLQFGASENSNTTIKVKGSNLCVLSTVPLRKWPGQLITLILN